jgi:hypothetical protein
MDKNAVNQWASKQQYCSIKSGKNIVLLGKTMYICTRKKAKKKNDEIK